jgi:phenylpropionate dioxygenase-like ring-hydroxylating dioxygenase large terminal subunit
MEVFMFKGFANVWTVVEVAGALKKNKPLAVKVAGEELVLFRDSSGVPTALLDHCPHRGVKLSLGKIKEGCLECPFHGWRFGASGENRNIPWNPDAKREKLNARSVPVRELAGFLWVYTAPVKEPPTEPIVPEAFLRSDVVTASINLMWNVHWTRAMENMLDWPHLPFVHSGTIGRGMLKREEARMDITWEEKPFGGHTKISIDGVEQPGALDFRFPNAMQLMILEGPRLMHMMAVCLPVDEQTTKMILIGARNFLRASLFNPIFRLANRKIAGEDKAIIESSFPNEVPEPSEEKSVRTDAPTLKFRKIYRDQLKGVEARATINV